MSNQIPHAPIEEPETSPAEAAGSYCCECGTFGAHEIKCLCCGFDFRAGGTIGADAAE